MSGFPIDEKVHELILGKSFTPKSDVGFHTIRYDFKPASVDTSKEANVAVGIGNQVTVTVPHVEGSGIRHTVFKGNKQPVVKECVLIIDHTTGLYTLEKITSRITVKKTRLDGSSKAAHHIPGRATPVDKKVGLRSKSKKVQKTSPTMLKNSPEVDGVSSAVNNKETPDVDDVLVGEITDSSDEEEVEKEKGKQKNEKSDLPSSQSLTKKFDVLDEDLALSEDSDSS